MTTIAVVAKECLPGRVKTRLSPPFTPEQAAHLAQACVDDTLETVSSVAARLAPTAPVRRVLFFDGTDVPASADGFEVVPQVAGGLDERLAHLFDVSDGPTVLIGMDTPQVDGDLLTRLCSDWPDGVDAWFGAAEDGGFWLLGLREPTGSLLRGVPMSVPTTGAQTRARLTDAGLTVVDVVELLDVDSATDAARVAALAPNGRLAAALAGLWARWADGGAGRPRRRGGPGMSLELPHLGAQATGSDDPAPRVRHFGSGGFDPYEVALAANQPGLRLVPARGAGDGRRGRGRGRARAGTARATPAGTPTSTWPASSRAPTVSTAASSG